MSIHPCLSICQSKFVKLKSLKVSKYIDENLVNCVEDCGDGNGDGEMESFEFLGKMIMDHDPIFSEIQV